MQECIRRLVSVIRRSSTGGSPVDSEQLEHIQKVVRVLSLSEEQVSSMRFEERAQVLSPGYEATPCSGASRSKKIGWYVRSASH